MTANYIFDTKSATFVDDALSHINKTYNLSSDEEYRDLIEHGVRSMSVIAEFQKMTLQRSSEIVNNATRSAVVSGYVSHFVSEVISARGFIEEIERKFLEDVPSFPKSDLLIPQFDKIYPNLKGIRNTLEHNAERRRGLKTGRSPIPNITPLSRPDGTLAKCGELVLFPPSLIKCHLSNGTVGEVDLELLSQYIGKVLTNTISRFPSINANK